MGLNGKNNSVRNRNLQGFLPEDESTLIKLINNYYNLFENSNDLSQNAELKKIHEKHNLKEEYSRLYGEIHQEIQRQQSLYSSQAKFSQRYEELFKKYDQKLKQPDLTSRQRIRYQKLWIQYGLLYAQYRQDTSPTHAQLM